MWFQIMFVPQRWTPSTFSYSLHNVHANKYFHTLDMIYLIFINYKYYFLTQFYISPFYNTGYLLLLRYVYSSSCPHKLAHTCICHVLVLPFPNVHMYFTRSVYRCDVRRWSVSRNRTTISRKILYNYIFISPEWMFRRIDAQDLRVINSHC